MSKYQYTYKDEVIDAQPNFGYYVRTGNLFFMVRLHEKGAPSRVINITEDYDLKLPFLYGLIGEGYRRASINFLIKYNLGAPTGEVIRIEDGDFMIFKFNENTLKEMNEKMFTTYKDNFFKK